MRLHQCCKWKLPCWLKVLLLLGVFGIMFGIGFGIGIFKSSKICLCSGCPHPAECPADWIRINQNCYHVSERMLNWTASEDFCKENGADLAVITNHTMNDLKKLNTNYDLWIGLYMKNDKWKWVDGTDYKDEVEDYSNDSRLNCAYLRGKIRALDCSTSRRFICNKTLGVVTS